MEAGKLNRKILLMRSTDTTNQINETITNLVEISYFYASVNELAGKEVFLSNREITYRTAIFTTHFRTNILSTDILRYDGLDWNILSKRELGNREGLEILAEVNNVRS